MTSVRSLFLRPAAVAVAALLAGAAAPARADFVLDDFSVPTPAHSYQITGANPNPYTTPTDSLGGGLSRTATVNVIFGVNAFSATGQVGGGFFEQSTPAASTAFSQLDYSFASAVDWGPGGAGVTGINTTFTFTDLNVPYSIVLKSDAGTSTYTGTITGPGTSVAPLADFTGTADLSAITGVSIFLNRNILTGTSTTSADFILDDVTVANPVPAPPAALLALSVLPVLGLRRLLRKPAA